MTDFSHWDFAENFSGYDAAALILGIEPTEGSNEQARIGPVVTRMKKCYLASRSTVADVQRQDGSNADFNKYLLPKKLLSNGLLARVAQPRNGLDIWLNDVRCFGFDEQEFSRDELTRWLSVIRIKSIYQFDLKQPDAIQNTSGRWPWGNHHTQLLGHLEAAAREFWVKYDPQNQKGTAPKRDEVIAWLRTRKVSNQTATAIATILRPDDLPTGPRK